MFMIWIQIIGILIVALVVVTSGLQLRKIPHKTTAKMLSTVVNFTFYSLLMVPSILIVIYPGIKNLDTLVGIWSIPFLTVDKVLGPILFFSGIAILVNSFKALGYTNFSSIIAPPRKLVVNRIYAHVRNPMFIGFCITYIGLGLFFNSLYIVIMVVFIQLPVLVFSIKFFEEYELELRFGNDYLNYITKPSIFSLICFSNKVNSKK